MKRIKKCSDKREEEQKFSCSFNYLTAMPVKYYIYLLACDSLKQLTKKQEIKVFFFMFYNILFYMHHFLVNYGTNLTHSLTKSRANKIGNGFYFTIWDLEGLYEASFLTVKENICVWDCWISLYKTGNEYRRDQNRY